MNMEIESTIIKPSDIGRLENEGNFLVSGHLERQKNKFIK
jgi:hypothetical protein